MSDELTPGEYVVLMEMKDGWVSPARYISGDTGLSERAVLKAFRSLAAKGLAELTPCFSEDTGHLKGRGYALTSAGLAIQIQHRRDALSAHLSAHGG
jgi:hypothetical protein